MSAENDMMQLDPGCDDELVLVDVLDRELGVATKERVHREGLLHRAFSVVLVREGDAGPELLLTQRAFGKYHSGGLWTNTCCSHPRAGEGLVAAAERRVREELGCETLELYEIAAFVYRAPFDNGLCEYEYDHVLLGRFGGELDYDPDEVAAVRWVTPQILAAELADAPEQFTAWSFTVFSYALSVLA